jgi:hypothetical protein
MYLLFYHNRRRWNLLQNIFFILSHLVLKSFSLQRCKKQTLDVGITDCVLPCHDFGIFTFRYITRIMLHFYFQSMYHTFSGNITDQIGM